MREADQPDVAIHMPYMEECASKADFVLELGMGKGNGSTRALSRGINKSTYPDKLMITVDCDPTEGKECPELPYWHFVRGDTLQYVTMKRVQEICGTRKADLIYIDTDHTYPHLKRELEVWRNMASPDTRWLFHDTWMFDAYNHMTDAIKEFALANPPLRFFDLTKESHGLGEMRRFIGINAGSGQRPFEQTLGWINMDIQPRSYEGHIPDIVADMNAMPFPDEYADMVVSHHTLEHMGCGDADQFIREAYRVLRPNGSLLIALPDIKALARRYMMNTIDDFIFISNLMGAYQGNEADRHKWHYTKESLTKMLKANGQWRSIERWQPRQVMGASIAVDWWILIVEAIK